MAGMGVGEALALATAVGGTAATVSAQNRQERDQRNTLNRQLERNDKTSEKVIDLVQDEAGTYAPDARAAALTAAEDAAVVRSQQDLEGAGGATLATAGDAGNVSKDFLAAKADRAITEGSRLTALSRELAKIRAPGQLQQDEAISRGKLAGELANVSGANANMATANGLDASSIGTPVYGQLGSVASALAGGYLGSKTKTPTTNSQLAWNTPATQWAFGTQGMGD